MASAAATTMDALAIGDFLADQQTGVLSLAAAGRVYSVPISYAYDEEDSDLYFRLGFGPDSQKRAFVRSGTEASFVVYDRTDVGWKSVVAEGRLEPLSETTLDSSVIQAVHRLAIPFFQTQRRPASELEFAIVRLDVTKLSGVAEGRLAAEVD